MHVFVYVCIYIIHIDIFIYIYTYNIHIYIYIHIYRHKGGYMTIRIGLLVIHMMGNPGYRLQPICVFSGWAGNVFYRFRALIWSNAKPSYLGHITGWTIKNQGLKNSRQLGADDLLIMIENILFIVGGLVAINSIFPY